MKKLFVLLLTAALLLLVSRAEWDTRDLKALE
jgi:hypothetical protein